MNRPLDHLTDVVVDRYVKQGAGTAFEMEDASIEAHLSNCGACLDRVLQAQRVHFGLLEADPVNRAPYQNCPEEQVLQELAAGICSQDVAAPALRHAAHCDYCGPLLNRYLEEFSEELQPEDHAILSQLASGKPEWQERLVREQGLGTPDQPKKRSFFSIIWQGTWWPKMALAGATAAVVLAVMAGPGLWAKFEFYRADRLVAAAYAERRTTEMRLTGLPYSPYNSLPVERGDEDQQVGFDRPAWHDASAFVGRKIKEEKQDQSWLEVEGRVSLLQGTSRSLAHAESVLEKARSQEKDNPSMEIDLAAAYFEKDSKLKPANLQRTINLLNEVLHQPKLSNQVRSVALFDLAIAYEKTEAWDMAVPIWKQYLQLDGSSPWAREAEAHLKDSKSKLRPPRAEGYDHPSFFLSHAAAQTLPAEVEEYQNIALELWLPRAVEDPNSDSYKAVAVLAGLLEQQHSDPWLKDLLAKLGPGDLPAVQALSAAVLANEEDLHEQALNQANVAAKIFAQHRNDPGRLRARIEGIYAVRRSLKASDCVAQASSLAKKLSDTRYLWMQAQLYLEKAACLNSLTELQPATDNLGQSLKIAESSRFPVLVLRNIQFSAGIKLRLHKYDDSWREAETGIARYWQGTYPQIRLEQLYSVMWQGARESDLLYTAKALLEHTLEMRNDPAGGIRRDRPQEIHLHERLANIFQALGEKDSEEEETRSAALLNKGLLETSGNFSLGTRIDAAGFRLNHGDAEFALSTLKPVGELLKTTQDNFISLNYFQVLGATYLQLRQLNDAAVAYRSAIQTAENTLDSLQDGGRRLQWMKAANESYRGMVRVLLEQKRDAEALQFWERYKGSSLAREPHLRESKETIMAHWRPDEKFAAGPDQIRLVYAVFDDGLQIWILKNKGIQSKWIKIKQEDLVRGVREFVEKCANASSKLGEVQTEGQKLFSLLLGPVVLEIPESRTVIVELDQVTNELPMEALLSPDGWYFGARYSVVRSPGMLMEKELRAPEAIGRLEPLLLVDAARTGSGKYLPGEELERTTIAQVFPNSRVMDAEHVSRAQLAGALLQSHIFHFIGHGRPDGEGAYLVLNKSESLRATDFSPELLHGSRLAVLSACSTGVSGENGLLDTGNLVHSFLAAGVPSVIASRWNVDSENTAKLMSSFYRHLEKRETVAQAISEARREMLLTQKHPYYWASFNLSGRAN
ncbi:MAG TPA: CHAT domain-containing protein [Candidatus Angelobacter sp.]|jgi:CHAT domain-containing protein|nr:CHAT domain-containing protein [Candidatus Angelobacter sp.]